MSCTDVHSLQFRQNVGIEFGSTDAAHVLAGIADRSQSRLQRLRDNDLCIHLWLSLGGYHRHSGTDHEFKKLGGLTWQLGRQVIFRQVLLGTISSERHPSFYRLVGVFFAAPSPFAE